VKIKVYTEQPNRLIRETCKVLRSRGYHKTEADALLDGRFNGKRVSFEELSVAQFCALEDTAVRLGLPYDGRQDKEETLPSLASS